MRPTALTLLLISLLLASFTAFSQDGMPAPQSEQKTIEIPKIPIEIQKLGFTEDRLAGYQEEDNEKYYTFFERFPESGDLIIFVVEGDRVKEWHKKKNEAIEKAKSYYRSANAKHAKEMLDTLREPDTKTEETVGGSQIKDRYPLMTEAEPPEINGHKVMRRRIEENFWQKDLNENKELFEEISKNR